MVTYAEALLEFKRKFFLDALEQANGNQCAAAANIGVHRNTMQRLLREAGLTRASIRLALAAAQQPTKKPVRSAGVGDSIDYSTRQNNHAA